MDKRPFAVYRTVEVDIASIINRLGRGITGSKTIKSLTISSLYSHTCLTFATEEMHAHLWHQGPDDFRNSTAMTIVRHHLVKQPNSNQTYLVIADRLDLDSQGLLIVNLNFCGHIDGVREKVYKTGDLVPSLDINHISWVESLRKADKPLFARKSFAIFAAHDLHPRMMMRKVHDTINGGLMARKGGVESVLAEWEGTSSEGIDDITEQWRNNTRERGWWNGGFLLVTGESWDKAEVVAVVETSGSAKTVEKLQVKADVAGELLGRLYVGLITVEELRSHTTLEWLSSPAA